MISGLSFSGGIATALDGLRQAERATNAAIGAVGSGSLDPDAIAQAAAILHGAQGAGSAAALALQATLGQQGRFIDILA
ncbi:hypothetical protein [Ferrovibrio sp.]|uniref:hypothetical protein n=1 Tax=Ferrovibrio sp. TaxID=1917215 RepID=UPI0035187034